MGQELAMAAVTSLLPGEARVDIAGARLFYVNTEQPRRLVPLPLEEQTALAGTPFLDPQYR